MKQDIEFVDWSNKDLAAGISFAESVQKPQARQSTDKTLFISRDDIAWTSYTSKQGHLRTLQEAYLHTDCVNHFVHGKQAARFDLFALRFSATADKAGCLQVRHCFTKRICVSESFESSKQLRRHQEASEELVFEADHFKLLIWLSQQSKGSCQSPNPRYHYPAGQPC